MQNSSGNYNNETLIKNRLSKVRRADFHTLNRRVQKHFRSAQNKGKGISTDLMNAIEQSIQVKQARIKNKPRLVFDGQLPINQRREELKATILEHQVVIVCGETGSGKTTQIPKLCLDAGLGIEGLIGHTQPRRLAARTVAGRIAEELDSELGQQVGYKIRHQDQTSDDTYIKLMTDGILLVELQHDRFLNQYDALIIDEAHERSLNIDFLLGYVKQLLPKRPDLKLIITSATIDVERFSAHFNDAPVLEVSGRSYPVEVRYRPEPEQEEEPDRGSLILNAVNELGSIDQGDILIFMEGEGEIHETDKYLRKQRLNDTDILPLYGRLSSNRQNRIFAPHRRRHIVLATNVAETSLTIPGIRYVIDTGMARISRYSHRSKVQRLPIEKIAKAAAEQRKGRCGRTSEGVCIRLYSEEDYESRDQYTVPEIKRTNLASVILQMKALKLGAIADFPFIDPPEKKFIHDGLNLLRELNALDSDDRLTKIGRQLARLPLDPRYARILLAAGDYHCVSEILVIISALSIQDPRERPIDNAGKADQQHQKFMHEHSDFLWFMQLWDFYHQQIKKLSQNKLRKLCRQHFLSYMRMREWQDIHRQLRHLCAELGLRLNTDPASYEKIHSAMLTGMPSQVAFLSDKYEYTGARDIKLYLFPASGQFQKKPKWVVAAELVETSRLYARNVARIETRWLIEAAGHLIRRKYAEAHWDNSSARVVALESISLYGMTLSSGRKINYGPINPPESRGLFIQRALVEGDFSSGEHFYQHNCSLMEELRQLEIRSRRPDILNEKQVYEFYDQALPERVFDGQTFASWIQALSTEQKQGLFLDKATLFEQEKVEDYRQRYPDNVVSNGIELPLEYRFSPGENNDGLNINVSLELLNQFDESQFDYLVPGLLEEKVAALLKSLPKSIRKTLVPVPDIARECVKAIDDYAVPLKQKLASYLYLTRGLTIDHDDWDEASLPDHLKPLFRVMDDNHFLLAQDRDLGKLQQQFNTRAEHAFNRQFNHPADTGEVHADTFEDVPVSQHITLNDNVVTVYPGLIDDGGKVIRHTFDNLQAAESSLHFALRALFKKNVAGELKYLLKNLQKKEPLILLYSTVGPREDLIESIINRVIDETFLFENETIRTHERFYGLLEYGRNRLLGQAEDLCRLLQQVLTQYRKVLSRLAEPDVEIHHEAVCDINEQLDYLVFNGFIDDVPYDALQSYPRYLDALMKRIEKLSYAPKKDLNNIELLAGHWQRIKQLVDNAYETDGFSSGLSEYRWMMEELRISVFTQEIKTSQPVSIKRMDKLWQSLQQTN